MRLLMAAGLAGPILFVGWFLIAGATRPGYEPLRQPVSLLLLADPGGVTRLVFLASGLLCVAFALGLRRLTARPLDSRAGTIAISLTALGLVLAGVFLPDPGFGYPPGAPAGIGPNVSSSAYLHLVGAILLFFGLTVACFSFGRGFLTNRRRAWAGWSIAAGVSTLVFFAASSSGPDGVPLVPAAAGLLQRLSLLAGMAWLATLAAAAIGEVRAPAR